MEQNEEKIGFLGRIVWGTIWLIGLIVGLAFAIVASPILGIAAFFKNASV